MFDKKISDSDVCFMSTMSWMSGLMLGMTIFFVTWAQKFSVMGYFAVATTIVFLGSSAAYLWRLKAYCEQTTTRE